MPVYTKILVLAKFKYHTNVPLGVCDRHTEMVSSSTKNGGLADSETLNISYSPCFPYYSWRRHSLKNSGVSTPAHYSTIIKTSVSCQEPLLSGRLQAKVMGNSCRQLLLTPLTNGITTQRTINHETAQCVSRVPINTRIRDTSSPDNTPFYVH